MSEEMIKNQIPISCNCWEDIILTARERMEIFVQESFIVAWLMEMNYLQDKMILDLIYTIGESKIEKPNTTNF